MEIIIWGNQMKGYKKPEKIEPGICFLCGKPCERYLHFECAIAYGDESENRIKKAKVEE